MFKAALALGLLSAIALVAVTIGSAGNSATPASAGSGGMEAMSIDMDPAGNTATELGQRDDCIEAEAGAEVTFDVTALNIPASNPMISLSYEIEYDEDNISVTAVDNEFLIASLPGSNLFEASEPVPDTDGTFTGAVLDTGDIPDTSETGSGVLGRVTVAIDAGAPDGGYLLRLTGNSVHIDPDNEAQTPDTRFAGQIAVGVDCDSLEPPPTPPAFAFGDVDCDGDVDAVDALQVLRHVAGLGANLPQGCPPIQETGDIDCDGDVDAVDALQILRHVAGLGANQGQGCPPVGV